MARAEPASLPPPPEPVRDYISSMSDQLAALARSIGDVRLAMILDLAATFAELPTRLTQPRDASVITHMDQAAEVELQQHAHDGARISA